MNGYRRVHIAAMLLLGITCTTTTAQLIPRWEILIDSSGSSSFWRCVAAADTRHFALIGSAHDRWTILRSTTTGSSWQEIFSEPYNDTIDYRSLAHPAPNLLIALGDSTFYRGISGLELKYEYSAFIQRSSDGGNTWERIPIGKRFRTRRSGTLRMADASAGYFYQLLTEGETTDVLWRTTDGGHTWSAVDLPAGFVGILDIAPFNATTITIRNFATIARSTDGGEHWETFPSTLPPSPFSLETTSSLTLYAAGSRSGTSVDHLAGIAYLSTDGGKSWRKVLDTEMVNGMGLASVRFADPLHGMAVGGAGVFRTSDGGESWRLERTPTTGIYATSIALIAMPAPDTVIALGTPMTVLRYVGAKTLAAPEVLTPAADATINQVTQQVGWTRVAGATGYDLQVAEQDSMPFPIPMPDYSAPLFLERSSLADTSFMLTGLRPGKDYFIRVRATGDPSASSWSLLRYIRVSGGSAGVPQQSEAAPRILYRVIGRERATLIHLPRATVGRAIDIVDIAGATIARITVQENALAWLDPRALPAGSYFLRYPAGKEIVTCRLEMLP